MGVTWKVRRLNWQPYPCPECVEKPIIVNHSKDSFSPECIGYILSDRFFEEKNETSKYASRKNALLLNEVTNHKPVYESWEDGVPTPKCGDVGFSRKLMSWIYIYRDR